MIKWWLGHHFLKNNAKHSEADLQRLLNDNLKMLKQARHLLKIHGRILNRLDNCLKPMATNGRINVFWDTWSTSVCACGISEQRKNFCFNLVLSFVEAGAQSHVCSWFPKEEGCNHDWYDSGTLESRPAISFLVCRTFFIYWIRRRAKPRTGQIFICFFCNHCLRMATG